MVKQIGKLAGIVFITAFAILSGESGAFAGFPENIKKELFLPYYVMGGTIEQSNQVDYYKFQATAGLQATVWLETESYGSNLAGALALYDSKGTLLAYNDGEWNLGDVTLSRNPILYIKLPQTATYYFAVSSAAYFKLESASLGDETGAYRISLFSAFDSPIPNDFYEPNDSPAIARHLSLPFETQGSLLYLGDIDWFSFDAVKGEKINVDIDSQEWASVDQLRIPAKVRVGVFDSGRQLVSTFDTGYDPDTGFVGDPALIFDVPADGRYYIAVTPYEDTEFTTLYNNPDFLQNPYVSGASGVIGFYSITVRDLHYMCIPQFAIGSFGSVSYKTKILLVNPSEETTTGSVSLFKADGTPFAVTFSLPGGSENSYWFSIQPKGQLILDADKEGSGSSGYATIVSTVPLTGSAIFSQYDAEGALVTEAAAQATTFMEYLAFPVDIGGDYNTGIAIANMSALASTNLYLKLVDTQGDPQADREVSLAPGEQISLYAGGEGQLFPNLTDFRGSLQVFADSYVSAIALRMSSRTLTTLPVLPMDQSFDPTTLIFPDMVSGAISGKDYRATLIMTNPGYFPVSGTIQFTQANGSPMPLRVGSTYSSRLQFQVPAHGSTFLHPSSAGGFLRGYAKVEANHSLGGVLVYSQYDAATGSLETEVAVPASTSASHFLVPAEDQGDYGTGLAIANLNSSDANLRYSLSSDSNPSIVIENGPMPLAAGHQQAQYISGSGQLFDGFEGTGVLEVISDQPMAAIALRLTAKTTCILPIVPIP
jgi:hypothetical protein